jgi:hypothetical protein
MPQASQDTNNQQIPRATDKENFINYGFLKKIPTLCLLKETTYRLWSIARSVQIKGQLNRPGKVSKIGDGLVNH